MLGTPIMTELVSMIVWQPNMLLGTHLNAWCQENRLNEISQEWDLNTIDLVKNIDTAIYSLLSNPEYIFPKSLPDGTYRR